MMLGLEWSGSGDVEYVVNHLRKATSLFMIDLAILFNLE